jgi:hypothetical protein
MAELKEFTNTLTWGTAPACSEHCNAIDRGYGYMVKKEMNHIMFEEFLTDDKNLEMWEDGFSASDVRILITQFLGEAVRRVNGNHSAMMAYFARTGCLMTTDGTGDEEIKMTQWPSYSFKRTVQEVC